MSQQENLLDLVNALYRKRKPIFLACVAAAILSAIASLMMTNYYKATTTFYAASPDLATPSPLGKVEARKYIYGSETDLDRLLSIGSSSSLMDHLIQKFDLYTHYEIDSTADKSAYKVRLALSKMYSIQKNKFDAIELSIEDEDPLLSAAMTDEAREHINLIGQQIIKGSQAKVLEGYISNIEAKEKSLVVLNDSLSRLKNQYKIFNANNQSKTYGEELTKTNANYIREQSKLEVYKKDRIYKDSLSKVIAKIEGYKQTLEYLEKSSQQFTSGAGKIDKFERMAGEQSAQLALDLERYNQLKSAYEAPFSALHVVQYAETPKIKSRPVRSLIVIGTTGLAFILSLIWFVFMHQYKDVSWKSVFSDEQRA